MLEFKHYYAALLRKRVHAEPRIDEALRDYQAMIANVQVAGIF